MCDLIPTEELGVCVSDSSVIPLGNFVPEYDRRSHGTKQSFFRKAASIANLIFLGYIPLHRKGHFFVQTSTTFVWMLMVSALMFMTPKGSRTILRYKGLRKTFWPLINVIVLQHVVYTGYAMKMSGQYGEPPLSESEKVLPTPPFPKTSSHEMSSNMCS